MARGSWDLGVGAGLVRSVQWMMMLLDVLKKKKMMLLDASVSLTISSTGIFEDTYFLEILIFFSQRQTQVVTHGSAPPRLRDPHISFLNHLPFDLFLLLSIH